MQLDEIRKTFAARGIRKAKVGGFDIDGVLRGQWVSLARFHRALEGSFGLPGDVLGGDAGDRPRDDGYGPPGRRGRASTPARVDPTTIRFYRHEPDAAHALADFVADDGGPHPACPRSLLRRVAARAEAAGYRPQVACGFEFRIFRECPASLHDKGFRDLTPLSPGTGRASWLREARDAEFLDDVFETFTDYRVPLEALQAGRGPGFYEASLAPSEVLEAGDRAALFKTTIKALADRHGLAVTFMAKLHPDQPGSSSTLRQSLWDSTGATDLLSAPKAAAGLSPLGRQYLAGQVALAPALTAVYAPTVNSYKRAWASREASPTASWAVDDGCSAVAVATSPGVGPVEAEYRQAGADINPYLALAASIGAGLYGIHHGLTAPPPTMPGAPATVPGPALPTTLVAAVQALRESEGAREVLGEAFVEHYARSRDGECLAHHRAVTHWELARYFEAV